MPLLELFGILHEIEYMELRGDGGTVVQVVQWRVKLGILIFIIRITRQQWCGDLKINK